MNGVGREREYIELAWTASSCLNAARLLCEDNIDADLTSDYDVRVIKHLVHLATELFLKAGIARSAATYSRTHDLSVLMLEYDAVSSRPLVLPRFIKDKIGRSADLFRKCQSHAVARLDERLRYPVDREGRWWQETADDDPEVILQDISTLERQITEFVVEI
jgi:hypothetical protein